MKTCIHCETELPESEFYPTQGDCKECFKARVRANRIKRLAYYTAYERKRAALPHRVAEREAYASTDHGKRIGNQCKLRWTARNPIKKRAVNLLQNAVRRGDVVRGSCEVCLSTQRVHGHHDDYSKPLDVRWLCPLHHREHHRINGGGLVPPSGELNAT